MLSTTAMPGPDNTAGIGSVPTAVRVSAAAEHLHATIPSRQTLSRGRRGGTSLSGPSSRSGSVRQRGCSAHLLAGGATTSDVVPYSASRLHLIPEALRIGHPFFCSIGVGDLLSDEANASRKEYGPRRDHLGPGRSAEPMRTNHPSDR
jgi:hypothetical protein